MTRTSSRRSGGTPEEIFHRWVESSSARQGAHEKRAARRRNCRRPRDFSYYNRKFVGDRLLRVGDAAGFMDPIFSAGVFLAMWSGKIAAEIVQKSLAQGKPSRRPVCQLRKARPQRADVLLARRGELLHHAVHGIIFAPANHHDLPSAVNAVLAGELEGGWTLRWRLKYFFLLVKLQKRWPLVPHLPFLPGRAEEAQTF